jgi:hypothetical protein
VEKSSPIICAISVIFTKIPKVISHPMGQKIAQSGHPGGHSYTNVNKVYKNI